MTVIDVQLVTKHYQVKIQTATSSQFGTEVAAVWQPCRIALVTDTTVGPLYLAQVQTQLTAFGFQVLPITVPAGEKSKSLAQTALLYEQLLTAGFNRGDGVIALGGGVVGDLAGFVASTYMRGIRFIQIPTSLLAQVDSSVGGKTAIDLPAGKNLVGTFYQPDLVLIDPEMLATLAPRHLVEGYAEIVKMAALTGGDFWQLVNQIQDATGILVNAEALITKSIAFKAQIVMADEHEGGQRRILNLGHTIGHAVEALANGQLMHGEAVSIGLVAIARIFEQKGLSPQGLTDQLTDLLQSVGLPVTSSFLNAPALLERISHDKKNQGQGLHLIYLAQVGQPREIVVPQTDVQAYLGLD